MTLSRVLPPPPPPPPPPLHDPPDDDPYDNENESEMDTNSNSINSTTTNGSTNAMSLSTISIRSAVVPDDIIQLLITPRMTQDEFAHCISHAALSPPHSQHLLQSWSSSQSSLSPNSLSFLRRNYRGGRRQLRRSSFSRNGNEANLSHGDYDSNDDSDGYYDDEHDSDHDGGRDRSTAAVAAAADWTRIAGLFRESDDAFVPIKILLHNPREYQNDLFRISRSALLFPPKRKRKDKLIITESHSLFSRKRLSSILLSLYRSKYFVHLFLLGSLSAIVYHLRLISYVDWDASMAKLSYHSEYMVHTIKMIPSHLDEFCITVPLQNLYRNGPNIIGWEGESLPKICQQVTHMADENFWLRNIEECTKIYQNKESAMLHVRKPLVYIILMYVFFVMIQSLIRTWATVRQNKNRPTYRRDIVETYEAFDMIMKVICRGMMKYAPPPPPSPRPLMRR